MFYIRHVTLPSYFTQGEFIGFNVTITNDEGTYLRAGFYDFHATIHQNGAKQPLDIFWTGKDFWDDTTQELLFQVILEVRQQVGKVEIAIHASPRHIPVGFDDLDTTMLLPKSWKNEAEFFGGQIIPLRIELIDGQPRDISIRRLQFPTFESRDEEVAPERPLLEIEELPRGSYHSTLDYDLVLTSWLAMLAYEDDLLQATGLVASSDIGYTLEDAFPVTPNTSLQFLEIGCGEGTLGIAMATLLYRMQINAPKSPKLEPTVLLTDNSQEGEAVARSNIERFNRNTAELLSHEGFGPVANIAYERLNWEQGKDVDTTGMLFASRKPWNHIIVNACRRCDQYETLMDALTTLYAATRKVSPFLIPRVVLLVTDQNLLTSQVLHSRGWLARAIKKIPMPNLLELTAREIFWVTLMKLPKRPSPGGKKNAEEHAEGHYGDDDEEYDEVDDGEDEEEGGEIDEENYEGDDEKDDDDDDNDEEEEEEEEEDDGDDDDGDNENDEDEDDEDDDEWDDRLPDSGKREPDDWDEPAPKRPCCPTTG